MRFLSWLIGLPFGVLIVVFALSNRQETSLGLWPFAEGLALPTFVAVLVPLLLGLVLGLLLGATRSLRHRTLARRAARRADGLERELEALRSSTPSPVQPASTPSPVQPASTPSPDKPAGEVILPS